MNTAKPPSVFQKILFWLSLGFISTFFAEVLSGSAPYFLLEGFGYVGIIPIYLLHTLVLAGLALRKGQPFSLRTLYFISLLFGMYEAYITKVLWFPPWQPDAFRIAGVAVFETILLVLCWHAIFSFLIPLITAEQWMTSSNRVLRLFPFKWQRRLQSPIAPILLGVFGSIMLGSDIDSSLTALQIVLLNCTVMSVILLCWRWMIRKMDFALKNLLPSGRSLWFFVILLALNYLVMGTLLQTSNRPGAAGHLAVLVIYAWIGFLIWRSYEKDKQLPHPEEMDNNPVGRIKFHQWWIFCAALCISSVLVNSMPPTIEFFLATGAMLVMVLGGIAAFVVSTVDLFRKGKTTQHTAEVGIEGKYDYD